MAVTTGSLETAPSDSIVLTVPSCDNSIRVGCWPWCVLALVAEESRTSYGQRHHQQFFTEPSVKTQWLSAAAVMKKLIFVFTASNNKVLLLNSELRDAGKTLTLPMSSKLPTVRLQQCEQFLAVFVIYDPISSLSNCLLSVVDQLTHDGADPKFFQLLQKQSISAEFSLRKPVAMAEAVVSATEIGCSEDRRLLICFFLWWRDSTSAYNDDVKNPFADRACKMLSSNSTVKANIATSHGCFCSSLEIKRPDTTICHDCDHSTSPAWPDNGRLRLQGRRNSCAQILASPTNYNDAIITSCADKNSSHPRCCNEASSPVIVSDVDQLSTFKPDSITASHFPSRSLDDDSLSSGSSTRGQNLSQISIARASQTFAAVNEGETARLKLSRRRRNSNVMRLKLFVMAAFALLSCYPLFISLLFTNTTNNTNSLSRHGHIGSSSSFLFFRVASAAAFSISNTPVQQNNNNYFRANNEQQPTTPFPFDWNLLNGINPTIEDITAAEEEQQRDKRAAGTTETRRVCGRKLLGYMEQLCPVFIETVWKTPLANFKPERFIWNDTTARCCYTQCSAPFLCRFFFVGANENKFFGDQNLDLAAKRFVVAFPPKRSSESLPPASTGNGGESLSSTTFAADNYAFPQNVEFSPSPAPDSGGLSYEPLPSASVVSPFSSSAASGGKWQSAGSRALPDVTVGGRAATADRYAGTNRVQLGYTGTSSANADPYSIGLSRKYNNNFDHHGNNNNNGASNYNYGSSNVDRNSIYTKSTYVKQPANYNNIVYAGEQQRPADSAHAQRYNNHHSPQIVSTLNSLLAAASQLGGSNTNGLRTRKPNSSTRDDSISSQQQQFGGGSNNLATQYGMQPHRLPQRLDEPPLPKYESSHQHHHRGSSATTQRRPADAGNGYHFYNPSAPGIYVKRRLTRSLPGSTSATD